jgi:hypothetical protein
MKKILFLLIALSLVGSSKLLSQVVVNEANPTKIVCGVTAHPLLVVNGFETDMETISDFVDPSKNLNSTVKKVQLNGKLLPDMKKLLIDKTALPATVLSADGGTVSNCSIAPEGILVINTKFAEKK